MPTTTRRYALALLAAAALLATVVAANYLTSHFGLVPALVPGLLVPAGTYAAGLAFGLRDGLHDLAGVRWVFGAIAAGAVLSLAVSAPQIALASAAAFLLAELLDLAVYSRLRDRGWRRAVWISNAVGAVADTLLFLTLAGMLGAASIAGQLWVKAVIVTGAYVLAREVLTRVRASRRRRQLAAAVTA